MQGHPISEDEFCTKFEDHFADKEDNYGKVGDASLPTVIKELGLPSGIGFEEDYDRVFATLNLRCGLVILTSRKNLNVGETVIGFGSSSQC